MASVLENISISVPTDADATAWFQLFNDAETMRYIGDGSIRDAEWYAGFVRAQQALAGKSGFCLYSLKVEDETVGFAGLHPWNHPWGPTGRIEAGWRLGRQYWGYGYAFRGAQLALARADELGIQTVSMIHAGNLRSLALAERLGMSETAEYLTPNGALAYEFSR